MLGTGMNARKLGAFCALFAATLNLIGCESSRDSPDRQLQKQVKRAQECRELQDKLVAGQPLTAERAEEITKRPWIEPDVSHGSPPTDAWCRPGPGNLLHSMAATKQVKHVADL